MYKFDISLLTISTGLAILNIYIRISSNTSQFSDLKEPSNNDTKENQFASAI